MKIAAMMLAGALGALARYAMTLAVQNYLASRPLRGLAPDFPLSTLLINVLGSLVLAFIVTLVARGALRPEWRLIVGTGFLGAFTTFSTFEVESQQLLTRGQHTAAALYIGGNLLLGFIAVFAGQALAIKISGGAS